MEQSPSWETNRYSVNKFHNILWDMKAHYSIHNRLLLIPILSYMSPDHALAFQSSFFKIHVNFNLLLIGDNDTKNVCFLRWKEWASQRKKETIICFWTSSKFLQNNGTYTGKFTSPSGTSELGCAPTKTDIAERSISIGRESLQVFLCTRRHGVRADFTARGQSWLKMVWTGNKKAFCVLKFAKNAKVDTCCVTKGGHIEHL